MNSAKEKIKDTIFKAIESYNAFQPEELKLEKNLKTVLFSRSGFTKEGKMDSIGLVNFLVLVEEKMKEEFTDNYTLDVSKIVEEKETLLKNVGALTDHLESLLKQH